MESSIQTDRSHGAKGKLGWIIQKIAHADDVHKALEGLYAVEGYDGFALRLMWCLERSGISTNGLPSDVVDYEVAQLSSILGPPVDQIPEGSGDSSGNSPGNPGELDAFYESVHRLGRVVAEAGRRGAGQIDAMVFFRILDEASAMKSAAESACQTEVARFSEMFIRFLQHVIDKEIAGDPRTLHITDTANLTLQTVIGAASAEDYDSLEQMTSLLSNPESLLE